MRSYQGIDISVYRDTAERANMLRIHTFLQDASRALSANVVVTSSSVGAAPSNAAYLTIGNDASLSAERAIVTTSPLTATDGGANSSWTLSLTASALDHGSLGGLADDDHIQYLLENGTRPLSNAWDAGNFAITLGSIVGKSGSLSLTAASGGAITLTSSIATGSSAFDMTDTVARTTGSYLRIIDSAASNILSLNATGSLFQLVIPTAATTHTSVMLFAGTTTGTGASAGINVSLANSGNTATGNSQLSAVKAYVSHSGTATVVGSRQLRGLRAAASVTAGNFGLRANDTIGNTLGVGFFNTGSTWPDVSYLVLHHNGTSPSAITRFTGLAIARPPVTPTTPVAIHAQGNVQMEAGDLLVFDGTATITNTVNGTADGRVTAQTVGDTYLTYSTGNTQLDVFVDAAQAFHFDAGGAAGTSRCYGNLLVSGTTTSTGLLTASAALTITTGNLTVTAGNAILTAGDLSVAATRKVILDGSGGDTYFSYNTAGFVRADVFVDANQAFHFGDGGAAGQSWCYGGFRVDGVSTLVGAVDAYAGIDAVAGDITVKAGAKFVFDNDATSNDYLSLSGASIGVTVGGTVEAQFGASGLELASGDSYTINSSKLLISETNFTHAPTSNATYTFTPGDALQITSTSTDVTRTMVDIFRNTTTNTRSIFQVRDTTNTFINAVTTTGITICGATTTKLGFYATTPIVQPSAYTQTYSTADKTHANLTSNDLAINPAINVVPWGFSSQANAEAIQTEHNALRADLLDLKQLVNSVIDDLQALGLVA